MLFSSLFLALVVTTAAADYVIKPVRLQGDAPYSHRRLYGIRRLKVVRPLMAPAGGDSARAASVRRHQSIDTEASTFVPYIPRAQVPPRIISASKASESKEVTTSRSTYGTTASPYIAKAPRSFEEFDEERRKRIEARWKRLGINMKTIQYPIQRASREKSLEIDYGVPRAVPPPSHSTKSIEDEEESKQVENFSPKKDDIRVPSSENTRKSVPLPTDDKDIQVEPPRRPRIHGPILAPYTTSGHEDAQKSGYGISAGASASAAQRSAAGRFDAALPPAAPILPRFASPMATPTPNREKSVAENSIQEDPNLTPFQNSARNRFKYGSQVGNGGPKPYTRTVKPPSTTEPVTTTTETTTTTTTTTTEVPVTEESEGDGGDSGASFGSGPSELPPELANVGFGIGGNGINFNVPAEGEARQDSAEKTSASSEKRARRPKQRKQPNPEAFKEELVIPQNSGLRPVAPPKEFLDGGGFGPGSSSSGGGGGSFGGGGIGGGSGGGSGDDSDSGAGLGGDGSAGGGGGRGGGGGGRARGKAGRGRGGGGGGSAISSGAESEQPPDLFTGDSALTPSRGPTGDGYGPPIFPGGAVPPPVPAVGLGGAAAGKSPYGAPLMEATENPPTTVKPSALLNVLNKADQGINQAITHFEQGSPLETAAIDILEVALGSQRLDSQAKLLGHVDRAIGLDNLQRIQRWANTAGAMDVFKEEVVKFIKNFEPPEDLLPTIPPQLDYLFKTSGR
ncbi:unnamed protein product [Cylicocyclus nassatus]|uniref:Uncharacterized protein n=1 Tax=Cylicocyclus nassatus TaxID=53992 RepID=A0AA36DI68_CYLNA|nr:unnamed protein product [Cylicocyclus nassatus]